MAGTDRIKCVLVGDVAVGKTSLIQSYARGYFPQRYTATAFDNYYVVVKINGRPFRIQLCDTSGNEEFASLRHLSYPETDVFILCFSVVSPISYKSIRSKWTHDIRKAKPHSARIILVGTQCDLRANIKVLLGLSQRNQRPVYEVDGDALARDIGAVKYIECSSLTKKNVKEVFDSAVFETLRQEAVMDSTQKDEVNMGDQGTMNKPKTKWKKFVNFIKPRRW